MTIREYLYRLEHLYYRRKRKFDRYMELSARASDPKSSINFGDAPTSRSRSNTREDLLIESSAALEEYYEANAEYWAFNRQLDEYTSELSLSERALLGRIYIDNRGRPEEYRHNGICFDFGIKKKDIPAMREAAEEHLRQILIKKGVEIED